MDLALQLAAIVVLFCGAQWLAGSHAMRLAGRLVFFAALSAVLAWHGLMPFTGSPPPDASLASLSVPLAKVIWWLLGASCLVGLVRVFLIFERKPREARLLQDLVVAAIYLGAFLSIVSLVFRMPVGTLVATSGVFAIILGLALQSTLADVFSGIALNIARAYTVGDLIVLDDGTEGRVFETNWRATYLLGDSADLIAIPNSKLARMRLVNRSAPEAAHTTSIKVRLRPSAKPSAMVALMETVLAGSNLIAQTPKPSVRILSLDARAIELELGFSVANVEAAGAAKNEIFDLAFRHASAAGMPFAEPAGDSALPPASLAADAALQHPSTAWRLLNSIPLLAPLTQDEKEALSARMERRTFRKDTIIAAKGEAMRSLLVIRSGIVLIERDGVELLRLSPGDWFGEGGLLMGTQETGTSRAMTPVVAYEIAQEDIAALLKDRPSIADEVGAVLSRRMEEEQRVLSPRKQQEATSFATRIRHLFNIGTL